MRPSSVSGFGSSAFMRSNIKSQLFRRDAKSANYALRACLAKISVEPAFARRYEALRAAVIDQGKGAA